MCSERLSGFNSSRVEIQAIRRAAQEHRKSGTYLSLVADLSLGELRTAVATYQEKSGFNESETAAYKATKKSIFKEFKEFQQHLLKDHYLFFPLKHFVAKILGIAPVGFSGQRSEEDLLKDQPVFDLLRKTGIIKTQIELLKDFSYDPRESLKNFFLVHQDIQTLIFGCGHFISKSDKTKNIEWILDRSMGCQMCKDEKSHSGELTIDLDIGQNPDFVADAKDPKIWEIFEDRFMRIKDESWSQLMTSEAEIKNVYRALKEGGVFETPIQTLESLEFFKKIGFIEKENSSSEYRVFEKPKKEISN